MAPWRSRETREGPGPWRPCRSALMALAHARFVPFPRAPRRAPTTWSRARALTTHQEVTSHHSPRSMQLCRRQVGSDEPSYPLVSARNSRSCHSPESHPPPGFARSVSMPDCQPVRTIEPNPAGTAPTCTSVSSCNKTPVPVRTASPIRCPVTSRNSALTPPRHQHGRWPPQQQDGARRRRSRPTGHGAGRTLAPHGP